jgi:hypothetical protein
VVDLGQHGLDAEMAREGLLDGDGSDAFQHGAILQLAGAQRYHAAGADAAGGAACFD